MKENNFEENSMDINNNSEGLKKKFLINSQEELVRHLKNAHDHTGGYMNIKFGIYKYLIYNPNNDGSILAVKLADMLYDGVIAPDAITNLDEILEYRSYILYLNDFLNFLYWFYDRSLSKQDIKGKYIELVERGYLVASKTDLENAASAFDTEQLNQNSTKYIINLDKQKDSLNKENYTQEDPLENYLLKGSINDISDLQSLLNQGQRIPWNKLAPALKNRSIKELDTLKQIAAFDKNNKIDEYAFAVFDDKSVGNWRELFEISSNGVAKYIFIFNELAFSIFKDGAFKGFNLNDTQTLKEYGLVKKSCFYYLPYVLWDIGRILIWAISCGKCCKYNGKYAYWFEKTVSLYKRNSKIEDAIKRIKENQEKELVSEQPKKNIQIEKNEVQNNIEMNDEFEPQTEVNVNVDEKQK